MIKNRVQLSFPIISNAFKKRRRGAIRLKFDFQYVNFRKLSVSKKGVASSLSSVATCMERPPIDIFIVQQQQIRVKESIGLCNSNIVHPGYSSLGNLLIGIHPALHCLKVVGNQKRCHMFVLNNSPLQYYARRDASAPRSISLQARA